MQLLPNANQQKTSRTNSSTIAKQPLHDGRDSLRQKEYCLFA